MVEEFEDADWVALSKDTRMATFWEKVRGNNISDEKGWEFLNEAWLCAAHETFNPAHLRRYKEEIRRERELFSLIDKFKRDYHYLPPWLSVDESKYRLENNQETQKIELATSSQKPQIQWDLGRYLVHCAIEIFGKPMYEAVAAVLTVLLRESDIEIDPDHLKKRFQVVNKSQE